MGVQGLTQWGSHPYDVQEVILRYSLALYSAPKVSGTNYLHSESYVPVLIFAGGVFTYLARLPMLGEACGTRLAYLTSLLEVQGQYCNYANEQESDTLLNVQWYLECASLKNNCMVLVCSTVFNMEMLVIRYH